MAKNRVKPIWNGTRNWTWRTRIKRLRANYMTIEGRGISQQHLANKLNVDRVTVAKWEQKRNNHTPSRLAQREIERLEKRIREALRLP